MSNAQTPEDLKRMMAVASALRDEQQRIQNTAEWAGIKELHSFYAAFTPSVCIALIHRIAAVEAELAEARETIKRLSAPVSDEKCPECRGTGTVADYVGLEMRCVEAECGHCNGKGIIAARAKDTQ